MCDRTAGVSGRLPGLARSGLGCGQGHQLMSSFDSVDHEWLMRMLAHRIADPRVLRLIRMWLEAGVLESGGVHETDRGTPQGSGISPLLANAFLHYILDLWV